MLRAGDERIEPEKNPLVRLARRFFPVTADLRRSALLRADAVRRVARRRRCCWCCWWWSGATWSSRSTAFRRSSRSPGIRSWSTAPTCSPSSASGRCSSCWPARWTASTTSSPAWPLDPRLRRWQDGAGSLAAYLHTALPRRHSPDPRGCGAALPGPTAARLTDPLAGFLRPGDHSRHERHLARQHRARDGCLTRDRGRVCGPARRPRRKPGAGGPEWRSVGGHRRTAPYLRHRGDQPAARPDGSRRRCRPGPRTGSSRIDG